MVTGGDPAAQAAKTAGFETPLVFVVGQDPVRAGLVMSMNRPGKATGVNFFTGDLGGKRVELLCAMAPSARVVGVLLNPRFGPERAEQHRQNVATRIPPGLASSRSPVHSSRARCGTHRIVDRDAVKFVRGTVGNGNGGNVEREVPSSYRGTFVSQDTRCFDLSVEVATRFVTVPVRPYQQRGVRSCKDGR